MEDSVYLQGTLLAILIVGHLSGIGDMPDDVYALESYKRKGWKENKAGAGFISCIGFTAPIKTPMFLNIIRNAGCRRNQESYLHKKYHLWNRMKYLLNRKSIKCSHKDRSEFVLQAYDHQVQMQKQKRSSLIQDRLQSGGIFLGKF